MHRLTLPGCSLIEHWFTALTNPSILCAFPLFLPLTSSTSPAAIGPRVKGNPYKVQPLIWFSNHAVYLSGGSFLKGLLMMFVGLLPGMLIPLLKWAWKRYQVPQKAQETK